jgi:hypothetical protein
MYFFLYRALYLGFSLTGYRDPRRWLKVLERTFYRRMEKSYFNGYENLKIPKPIYLLLSKGLGDRD